MDAITWRPGVATKCRVQSASARINSRLFGRFLFMGGLQHGWGHGRHTSDSWHLIEQMMIIKCWYPILKRTHMWINMDWLMVGDGGFNPSQTDYSQLRQTQTYRVQSSKWKERTWTSTLTFATHDVKLPDLVQEGNMYCRIILQSKTRSFCNSVVFFLQPPKSQLVISRIHDRSISLSFLGGWQIQWPGIAVEKPS